MNGQPSTTSPRIAIIGGGIAGISAAIALSSRRPDFQITLLESRRAGGGRAGSFRDPTTDDTVDYCQHVAMGCCTNFIDLLNKTGLEKDFSTYQRLTFYRPGSGMSQFAPDLNWPAPLHLRPALAGLRYLTLAERTRISMGIFRLMRQSENSLATTTAANWLSRYRQDSNLREKFWDVILVSALGDVPERVSMAAARKVIVDGFAGARGASDVWVPNRPLSEIFSDSVFEFMERLGIDVRIGSPVQAIHPDEQDDVVRLQCNDCHVEADHVILATGWRAALSLIESIPLPADSPHHDWQSATHGFLDRVNSSPITGMHLWFDRSLTDHPHVVMVGTTSQWLFRQPLRELENSLDQEPSRGVYHQIVISGVHPLSDAPKEQLLSHVLGELKDAFPESFTGNSPAKLLHHRIVTDPNAVYSVTPEFQADRPSSSTPMKWLSLAGDYVQTGWPATMEGATISGRLAADDVLSRWSEGNERPPSTRLPPLKRGRLARWLIRDR